MCFKILSFENLCSKKHVENFTENFATYAKSKLRKKKRNELFSLKLYLPEVNEQNSSRFWR